MNEMLPGQVITPGNGQSTETQPVRPASAPTDTYGQASGVQPTMSPSPPSASSFVSPVPEPPGTPLSDTREVDSERPAVNPPSFASQAPLQQTTQNSDPAMAWSAAEFIRQEKGARWYAVYVLGLIVLSAAIYYFTGDIISTGMVFVALLGLLFLSLRRPKTQEFSVEGNVLAVGNKTYDLHDFKAFSVINEAAFSEVTLLPIKRFTPPVAMNVHPDQIDALTDHLADYLPFEQRKADAMDSLLRRIRF